MVKKIIIDDKVLLEEEHQNRSRGHHPHKENLGKHQKFQGDTFRKYEGRRGAKIVETRLFTDRNKLVEYVNEKGQSDALIDIYKIEEGLYKLVIKR